MYSLNENKTGVLNAMSGGPSLINLWFTNPLYEITMYGKEWVLQATYIVVIGFAILPFIIFAGMYASRSRNEEALVVGYSLAAFAVLLLFMYPALLSSQRYVVLPLLVLFFVALSFLIRMPKYLFVIAVIICVLGMTVRVGLYVERPVLSHEEALEAALYVNSRCPSSYECVIMSRTAWTALHSRQEHLPLPYANNTDLLTYARYHNTTFIVIEERALKDWPQFNDFWWLGEERGVWLVYETNTTSKARIFEVTP